jgi:pimeloyl-ACP methyl ester carboxylesterase
MTKPMNMARVGGLELCWDSFGDRRDPAIILVMGLGTQMTAWLPEFCEQLASHGRWVVRFDNRDIGLSTRLDHLGVPNILKLLLTRAVRRSAEVPYRIEDMARDVLGLMDTLELEQADLAGVSMGGMIVQTAAILAPGRIRSIASIMSTTGDHRLPWPRLRAVWWLSRAAPKDPEARAHHYLRLFREIGGGHYHSDPEENLGRIRDSIERAGFNDSGKARQYAAVLMQGDRTEALRGLDLPALVMHGAADPLVRPACGEATAAAIPGAEMLLLEDLGHELPEALFERMAAAIDANARRAD